MAFDASNIVFFFGAGASAPFGIPTMKQFVVDFEKFLKKDGSKKEREFYNKFKTTLQKELPPQRTIDLEDIFTLIDGYINLSRERLGVLSLYLFHKHLGSGRGLWVSPADIEVCRTLRNRFQKFVRDRCLIPEESFSRIATVYHDFFNRFIVESATRGGEERRRAGYLWHDNWAIFTTKYDTCLEYYWRQVARAPLNTGFSVDEARRTWILDPSKYYQERRLRLLKLHGSISWQVEPDETVTEEQILLGRSLVGREFVGELMIYPIEQKELYVDPYISMFVQLNRELKEKPIWIIIGYSFNDPVIREVFIRNSDETKRIILLHPHAKWVKEETGKG